RDDAKHDGSRTKSWLHRHRQVAALAHPGIVDRPVHGSLDDAAYRPEYAGDDPDQRAFHDGGSDPDGRGRALALARHAWRADAARRDPAMADRDRAHRALAALFAAVRRTDSWLGECLVARLHDRDVRPRIAETFADARARLGMDRGRACAARLLRDADAGRPACRCRALSLFHPPRRRVAAHATGRSRVIAKRRKRLLGKISRRQKTARL